MRDGRKVKKNRRQMLVDRITEMDPEQAERSILRHSYDAWREVIDFLHIPEKAFPDFVYHDAMLADKRLLGHSPICKTIMDGTWEPTPFIRIMRSINKHNAEDILRQYPTEFHYLRSKLDFEKNPQFAAAYLANASPANIIRFHEYLWFPSTADIIERRLVDVPLEKPIHHPYSLFFDLLYVNREMMSKDLYHNLATRADRMIGRFDIPVQKPALVAVDQSSSMNEEQVKIGTAIATLVGQQLEADLCYFYGDYYGYYGGYSNQKQIAEFEDIPLGTEAAIGLVDRHQPRGNTPVAQIMEPYLEFDSPTHLKSLVIVTDEGENSHWNNMLLVDALRKYREKVGYNIEIMVIAIQSDHTIISDSLRSFHFNVSRYRCDSLRHIESLFALIQAKTAAFLEDQSEAKQRLVLGGTTKAVLVELDQDLRKYKHQRDDIFATVIKGMCTNCGAPLGVGQVNLFRLGETITCGNCDFTLSPTLFGVSHV